MGVSHFSAVSSTWSVYKKAMAADITLTENEAVDNGVFEITPSASKKLIFPKAIEGKVIIVANLASATYTVTVAVGAETGITIAAAKSAILRCNGTDWVRVTADA